MREMAQRQSGERQMKGWLDRNTVLNDQGLPMLGPDAGKDLLANKDKMLPSQYASAVSALDRSYDRSQHPHDDPQIVKDLTGQIENGDPRAPAQIALNEIGKSLTPETARAMRQLAGDSALDTMLRDPGVRNAYEGVEHTITQLLAVADPFANGGAYVPGADSTEAVASVIQKAKVDALAAIAKAPTREAAVKLLDPTNPDSVVSAHKIMMYRQMVTNFRALSSMPTVPGTPVRGANESAEDFLRRLGEGKPGEKDNDKPQPSANEDIIRMKQLLGATVPLSVQP